MTYFLFQLIMFLSFTIFIISFFTITKPTKTTLRFASSLVLIPNIFLLLSPSTDLDGITILNISLISYILSNIFAILLDEKLGVNKKMYFILYLVFAIFTFNTLSYINTINSIYSTVLVVILPFIYFFILLKRKNDKISKQESEFSLLLIFSSLMSIIPGFSSIYSLALLLLAMYLVCITYLLLLSNNKYHASLLIKVNKLEENFERSVALESSRLSSNLQASLNNIRSQSLKDSLTKAYNRDGINQIVANLIDDRRINFFSVILFDIDNFKTINDTLGHIAGDNCLKFLSYEINTKKRPTDYFCRFGGDEFLLILPNENLDSALLTGERFSSIFRSKSSPKFTISMGLAIYPFDGTSLNSLVEVADNGLYQSKEKGRDKISYTGKAQ